MQTIPAREVKRRGISALDSALEEGPVHVIKNDEPRYVVLTEQHYRELVEAQREAELGRIRASLEDVRTGRVRRFASAHDLMEAIGCANDPDEG